MIDKIKTAMINGYTEGQAWVLNTWSEDRFLMFMEDMILPDGRQKQYVYTDGSIKKLPPVRKAEKIEWRKSKYGGFWWCLVEDAPSLALDLNRNGGKVTMGGYEYSIKEKYIKKKISSLE